MRRRETCGPLLWGVAVVICVLVPSLAFGHRLNVFAYVEGDAIGVEAYFSDGKGARDADVAVFGPDDKQLLSGKTDVEGKFSFAAPATASDLKIVVTTGDQHEGSYTLKADELGGAPSEQATPAPDPGGAVSPGQPVSRLEAKLTSIQRELNELKEKISLDRVIAGIGFIVGLSGVAMYFMARGVLARARRMTSKSESSSR
jgi:nickel transport protein